MYAKHVSLSIEIALHLVTFWGPERQAAIETALENPVLISVNSEADS